MVARWPVGCRGDYPSIIESTPGFLPFFRALLHCGHLKPKRHRCSEVAQLVEQRTVKTDMTGNGQNGPVASAAARQRLAVMRGCKTG